MKKVIALDPGGTTGLAYNDGYDILKAQIAEEDHNETLYNILDELSPDVVVSEDFQYRQSKNKIELVSRDYIGVARLWCQLNDRKFHLQQPGNVKAFWTDVKLKRMDLYTPGEPHANDSVRHLLYYITFELNDTHFVHKARPPED